MKATCPGAALEAATDDAGTGAAFRAFTVDGASGGRDVLEVLLKPDPAGGSVATYRSLADPAHVRYIFPFQTALSDGGAQRARVAALRARTGWRAIGCDLLECFQ